MICGFDCIYIPNTGINKPHLINRNIDYTHQLNKHYSNMYIINFEKFTDKKLVTSEMVKNNLFISEQFKNILIKNWNKTIYIHDRLEEFKDPYEFYSDSDSI